MSDKPCQLCGAHPAVLYACGVRCPDHTPAKAMGLPEPQGGYGAQFRAEHLARQQAVVQAVALKEKGLRRVEGSATNWDRQKVDETIKALAATGKPFSANEIRERLPVGVRDNLIAPRLLALSRRGAIRQTGMRVPSTKSSTHGHKLEVWEAA